MEEGGPRTWSVAVSQREAIARDHKLSIASALSKIAGALAVGQGCRLTLYELVNAILSIDSSVYIELVEHSPSGFPNLSLGGGGVVSWVWHAVTVGLRDGVLTEHISPGGRDDDTQYSLTSCTTQSTNAIPTDTSFALIDRWSSDKWFGDAARMARLNAAVKRKGWILDHRIDIHMGLRVRCLWPGFGYQDGSVTAYLPSYRECGPFYRITFDNHDFWQCSLGDLTLFRKNIVDNVTTSAHVTIANAPTKLRQQRQLPPAVLVPSVLSSQPRILHPVVECFTTASSSKGDVLIFPLRRFKSVFTAALQLGMKATDVWALCMAEENRPKAYPTVVCVDEKFNPKMSHGVGFRLILPSALAEESRSDSSPSELDQMVAIHLRRNRQLNLPSTSSLSSFQPGVSVECYAPTAYFDSSLWDYRTTFGKFNYPGALVHRFADVYQAAGALGLPTQDLSNALNSNFNFFGGFQWKWYDGRYGAEVVGDWAQPFPLKVLRAMRDSDETLWQRNMPLASDSDPRFLPVGLYEGRSKRSLRLFRSPVEASLSLSIPLHEITCQLCTDGLPSRERDDDDQYQQLPEYQLCWIGRLEMSSEQSREWLEESNRRNLPVSRILQFRNDPARLAEWAQRGCRARKGTGTCRGTGGVSNNDAMAEGDDEDDEDDEEDEEDDAVDEWAEEAAKAMIEQKAILRALPAFWEQFKAERALAMSSDASPGTGRTDRAGAELSDHGQSTEVEMDPPYDDGEAVLIVKQGQGQGQCSDLESGVESDRDSCEPAPDLKRKALSTLNASRNQQLAAAGWILEQSSDFPDSQWIGCKVRKFLPDRPHCWVDSTVTAVMPDTAVFPLPYSLHAVAGSDETAATSRVPHSGASCFNVVDGRDGSHEQLSLAALQERSDFYEKKLTCDPGSTKYKHKKTGPRPATVVRAIAPASLVGSSASNGIKRDRDCPPAASKVTSDNESDRFANAIGPTQEGDNDAADSDTSIGPPKKMAAALGSGGQPARSAAVTAATAAKEPGGNLALRLPNGFQASRDNAADTLGLNRSPTLLPVDSQRSGGDGNSQDSVASYCRTTRVSLLHQAEVPPFDHKLAAVFRRPDFDWELYLSTFTAQQDWDPSCIGTSADAEQFDVFMAAAKLELVATPGTLMAVLLPDDCLDCNLGYGETDVDELERYQTFCGNGNGNGNGRGRDRCGRDESDSVCDRKVDAATARSQSSNQLLLFGCSVSQVDRATRRIVVDCGAKCVIVEVDSCCLPLVSDDELTAMYYVLRKESSDGKGNFDGRLLMAAWLVGVTDYAAKLRKKQWCLDEVSAFIEAEKQCGHIHVGKPLYLKYKETIKAVSRKQGAKCAVLTRSYREFVEFALRFFPFKNKSSGAKIRRNNLLEVFAQSTYWLSRPESTWPTVASLDTSLTPQSSQKSHPPQPGSGDGGRNPAAKLVPSLSPNPSYII